MMTVKREVCLIHGAINGVEVSFIWRGVRNVHIRHRTDKAKIWMIQKLKSGRNSKVLIHITLLIVGF